MSQLNSETSESRMNAGAAFVTFVPPIAITILMIAAAHIAPWTPLRIAAGGMTVVGLAILTLARLQLGNSFSITPQARRLVTPRPVLPHQASCICIWMVCTVRTGALSESARISAASYLDCACAGGPGARRGASARATLRRGIYRLSGGNLALNETWFSDRTRFCSVGSCLGQKN